MDRVNNEVVIREPMSLRINAYLLYLFGFSAFTSCCEAAAPCWRAPATPIMVTF